MYTNVGNVLIAVNPFKHIKRCVLVLRMHVPALLLMISSVCCGKYFMAAAAAVCVCERECVCVRACVQETGDCVAWRSNEAQADTIFSN